MQNLQQNLQLLQQNLQNLLQSTLVIVQAESTTLSTNVKEYFTPMVNEVIITTEFLPYQNWLNNSVNFLDIYSIHLLFMISFSIMIFVHYVNYCNQQKIIENQQDMIVKFTNTESMKIFKLQAKLTLMMEENQDQEKEIESMKNTVKVYRALRLNKAGYFLLKGDPSSRTFRMEMRDLGDTRYIGGKEYMVKLKHLKKFDNQNVTV